MGQTAKRIVISGYYGFRNSGDEAVLQSILQALEEQGRLAGIRIEPVVLSMDPELTRQMYGVEAVHRMKPGAVLSAVRSCDGLISGGGSLLQDATGSKTIPYYLAVVKLAQWLGKPTFIYSQGIGPVGRKLFYPMIRHVFNRASYVSVRDQESADLLTRMGYTKGVEVVPDPVMGLPLRSGMESDQMVDKLPIIGVSVRYWNKDKSELHGLAESLSRIAAVKKAEIRFLPFHLPSDTEASREVMERLSPCESVIRLVDGVEHPQDMLHEVSQCDLIIGMRLHSLIYAASQRVPVLGISYDPKIDQFLQRLDLKAAASTERFEGERVTAEAIRLLDQKQAWIDEKSGTIDKLKQQAQQPAKQIAAILRQKEENKR